eukprot:SAG31_NODE_45450_length_258_cov_2.597484_1_plen_48_part_10
MLYNVMSQHLHTPRNELCGGCPLASTPADAYIVDTTHRANENHRYHPS